MSLPQGPIIIWRYNFYLLLIVTIVLLYINLQITSVFHISTFLHPDEKRDWLSRYAQNPDSAISFNSITNRELYNKSIRVPSVLLRPRAGLGNQLFQYACHYTLARKKNWPLYTFIDSNRSSSSQSDRQFQAWNREFGLDYFKIPLTDWNTIDSQTWDQIISHPELIAYISDSMILSGSIPDDRLLIQSNADFCQSEVFFSLYKKEIIEMFTLRNVPSRLSDWLDLIDSKMDLSIAVHIRRGDFVTQNIVVPITFQLEAMERIGKLLGGQPTFFVFSDDIAFAEKEILNKFREEVHFLSKWNLTSLEEFHLMSKCKHHIIPNSSFGWWAAYLNPNPNKIVIAAHHNLQLFDNMFKSEVEKKEFFKFEFKHIYYPPDWITVDMFHP